MVVAWVETLPGNKEGARKAIETKKQRYGEDYAKKIATDHRLKYGNDYYMKLGSKGGAKSGNRPMTDPAYASRLGKISAEKRRQKKSQNSIDSK